MNNPLRGTSCVIQKPKLYDAILLWQFSRLWRDIETIYEAAEVEGGFQNVKEMA